MKAPRVFDACNVPMMAALCIAIQSGLHFNDFCRWPDKCDFMFEDGREVTWEEDSHDHLPEVYRQFLEGLKSQGERDVPVRNHAMSYQMNVEGKMIPEQVKDIEVMGHVTLYYR